LNNKKEALAWLDSAAQGGFMNSWYLENDPLLNNIRGDAEFIQIQSDFENHWQQRVDAFKKAIEDNNNPLPEIKITVGQQSNL
jgi:hypothetical protein